MNQEQTILGTQFDQTLREQLEAQQVYSPVTNTNISLVLDPTAPVGDNPYVADITVLDTKGNMALGSLPVSIKASNGAILATGTAVNGTTRITLPDYELSATAVVGGNNFYIGSQAQNFAKFDVGDMLRRLGPPGSDPVTNAKWAIISNYTIDSGAFNHNDVTENYTWNGHDNWNGLSGCYKWTDSIPFYGSVDRGYCVISAPQIAASELESHTFDSQKFVVRQYWGAGVPPSQYSHDWTQSKMDFFTLWLGQKLEPTSWGGNPHDPSGYTQFNALANDLAIYADKIDNQQ